MIYLTKSEVEYLKTKLAGIDFYISQDILTKLIAQEEEWAGIEECPHKMGAYTGEKTCCVRCGAFYDPGMGETWILKSKISS